MNFITHQFRKIAFPFSMISFWIGNKKMKKWMKKNDKYQDPNYYPFEERWSYSVKKSKKLIKAFGIKIIIKGEDNIPKSSSLVTPNHVSNADVFILASIFGKNNPCNAIAKKELEKSKIASGYVKALETHLLDTKNIRDALVTFDVAGRYAKDYKRPLIVFPEGTRNTNEDGTLNEFKAGAFNVAQKYYLPIVPVSIIGAKKSLKWKTSKTNIVVVTFHKPLKQKEIIKLPTTKISERVKSIIQKDLDKFSDGKVT